MGEIQAYFRIPIQDWLILDNCCRWALHTIEQKPRIGKGHLNYKDEHYKKWVESVRNNIQEQVQESTSDADPQEINKQLADIFDETTEDFLKVMQGSQEAVWKTIASGGK